MDIEELLAREEIRQLQVTYNTAGDRGKREEFGSVFSEDAVMDMSGEHVVGRVAILDRLFSPQSGLARDASGKRKLNFVRHNLTTSKVDFTSPTTANGRTYFAVITDIGLDHSGVYIDKYAKKSGRWWIVFREVRIDFVAENRVFGSADMMDKAVQQRNAKR